MPEPTSRIIRLTWEDWQVSRALKRAALEAKGLSAPSRRTTAKREACAALGRINENDMPLGRSVVRRGTDVQRPSPTSGVRGNHSSMEAGNGCGAKGFRIESTSNRSVGADSLRKKRMTDEGIASIEAKHRMAKFLNLVRQWLKACAREPNGVMVKPKGRCAPQGGVISPLLSNICLHWFETIVGITAKAAGQSMTIVRYADDFVLLAKSWREGFLQKVESILEERRARFLNRKSQRSYRLKFADSYCGEMAHYGLYRLVTLKTRI